jgi:DNA-binding MarR family transcriptional regulator
VTGAGGTDLQGDLDLERAAAEVEEYLRVIVGRVRSAWKEAAAGIHPELQPVGYKVLSTIVRLGETNAYLLAEVLGTDKSVVSRQVRMLEDAHLVACRADDRDGRVRVLSPTAEAVEQVNAVKAQQHDRVREILRGRPEHEVRAFSSMLKLVSEAW